jgi:hypothetical protein
MILAPSRDVRGGMTVQPLCHPQSPKKSVEDPKALSAAGKFLTAIEGAECVYEIAHGVAYDVVIDG